MRRYASLLAAAGLLTAATVTAAAPAEAAGTCSLYVQSRIVISQPYRAITVKEGPNCAAAYVSDAAWSAYHSTQGQINFVYFQNGARTDIVDVYDFEPLGRWTWRPEGAYTSNFDAVFQYTTYTDVRLGSFGRVVPTRIGSKINVKTKAGRYWVGGSKFIGWSGARGQIQWRTPGSSTWHALKDVYSTSTGTYSYTYTTSLTRDYRVVLMAAPTIWGSTSPIVRR